MGTKALLIGLDGLDDAQAEALMSAGDLPNLKALKETSRLAPIRNYPGMGAGVFWSSAACGVTPDHHGRYFHLQFDQRTYDVKPFEENKSYRMPAFWKTLDEEGLQVAIIDWHRGPFQEMKNGLLLDNWLGHDATSGIRSYPEEAASKILEEYGGDPLAGGSWNRDLGSLEAYRRFISEMRVRIEKKTLMVCKQLRDKDWDLYAPCFSELHDAGHYIYHITDHDHPKYDPDLLDKLGDPLRECYAMIDRAVGEIIDAAGPDAAVMLLAGPGMMRLVSANTVIEEITRRLDLGTGAPHGADEQAKTAYRSFLPDNLRRKIAPFARFVRRNLANSMFARRRFFALPHNDNSACIRINLKGREAMGIVEPGASFDETVEEIRNGLMEIEDADSGIRIVENVVSVRHNYNGPNVDMLPDIFVEWNRGGKLKSIRRIRSPRIGEISVPQSRRTGDHTPTGFFWARGIESAVFNGAGERKPHEVTDAILRAARKDIM